MGKPILPLTGTEEEPLSTGLRLGGVPLTLTFNSSRRLAVGVGSGNPQPNVLTAPGAQGASLDPTGFGPAWFSSFHRQLLVTSSRLIAYASRGNGAVELFTGDGTGNFAADPSSLNRLSQVGNNYILVDTVAQTMEVYSLQGQLLQISSLDGATLRFNYADSTGGATASGSTSAASSYALVAVDAFGRSLAFNVNTASTGAAGGLVAQLYDPAGQATQFAYDGNGNLSQVTWPDATKRSYLYENTALPWALTGALDENGNREFTIGYDSNGRATSSVLANGVEPYLVTYDDLVPILVSQTTVQTATAFYYQNTYEWGGTPGATVTQPNGSSTTISGALVANTPRQTSMSQPAGSGCAASNNTLAYDNNGNLTSSVDFNGVQSCFVNDPNRNLTLTTVTGLSSAASCASVTPIGSSLPAGSRMSNTVWHPNWNLAVQSAEPGKLTTNVYNGQPDPFSGNAVASCAPASALLPDGSPIAVLCKKVEQATTDGNGSQGFGAALNSNVSNKIWTWTYNAQGQRLSATDPRGNTSTYSYYATTVAGTATQGDLQSVTNAQGQITQYTQYDPYGNLLQSVDPNGVTTTNTYDARQRLTSTSVGGQTTSYQYDLAGQLIKVNQPDGASMSLSYDPAHRLVGVSDSLGNSVSYTLDSAGNRIAEQVSDASGRLSTQLSRVFDALNRKQQATGME